MSDQSVRIHTYLRCCIGDTTERCDQCMGEKRDCELGMAEARSIEHYTLALEAVAEAAREEVNNTCDANMRKLQHAEAINCQACWHRKTCSALATLDALEGKG